MGKIKRFKRVYVEITNICNLSCTFCQKTEREGRVMSAEEFLRVIRQVKPYTDYIYLHVKGEPLLHPQMEQLLEICEQHAVRVNVTTNGTLLRKQLDILKKHPVHQINISMHSAKDNLEICVEDYIKDMFFCCEQLNQSTDTEISIRLWNTHDKPELFGQNNCGIRRRLSVNVRSPFEWPDIQNEYRNESGFCQGLRTHFAVLCDGTVVPCCLDGNGLISLGNIFEAELADILSRSQTVRIIENFRNRKTCEELCVHCSYKERF